MQPKKPKSFDRRTFLGLVAGGAATVVTGVAVARAGGGDDPNVLRVGVMANLTHAPLLAAIGSGRLAEALAPAALEVRVFRAGPRVTEALLGNAIDVGTAGPAPIVIHHARHPKNGFTILSGLCSGGASLVVTPKSGIRGPEDFANKRLAVAQIGATQDVALRVFLREHGYAERTRGGNVEVLAISPATILAQMTSGSLDGAWLAEPWATRMVKELAAVRIVDERDLWPDRRFTTALAVTRRATGPKTPLVKRFNAHLVAEVRRAVADPQKARDEAYAELKQRVGNPGKKAIFDAALPFVDFTDDALAASVDKFARDAQSLGFLPPGPIASPFG